MPGPVDEILAEASVADVCSRGIVDLESADISPRLRWKLERIGNKLKGVFGGTEEQPRPKLCPACGNLVGATAKSCHQCGASMTYSMAANLTGWSLAIERAAVSPTKIWNGVRIAAGTNPMANPV